MWHADGYDMKPYWNYWGKTNFSDSKARDLGDIGFNYALLPYHLINVAAVADLLLGDYPRLKQCRNTVLFYIAMHDIGKIDYRFQMQVPKLARELNDKYKHLSNIERADHGYIGWYDTKILNDKNKLGLNKNWLMQAAIHHGWDDFIQRSNYPEQIKSDGSKDWAASEADKQAKLELVADLSQLFKPDHSIDCPLEFAGFCTICDWMGSSIKFGLKNTPCELVDEFAKAKSIALTLINDANIRAKRPKAIAVLDMLGGLKPRGFQSQVDNWPLRSGLTFIMAPPGCGKTEVALSYALRMVNAGIAESIIFALPSQATTNMMASAPQAQNSRISKLTGFYDGPINTTLAHGASLRSKLDGAIDIEASDWMTDGYNSSQLNKKALLGHIVVCTVDQVMMAVLNTKHKWLRKAALKRSILIIDELHAYDAYMQYIIKEVIKIPQHTICMSATMLPGQVSELIDRPINNNYPQAIQLFDGILSTHTHPLMDSKRYELKIKTLDEAEDVLKDCIDRAKSGQKIAIICNTVKCAQANYELAVGLGYNDAILFHSRYRYIDRASIEQEVIAKYRKGAENAGSLVIATQVIEQSLDISFDYIVSYLCPIDALLQRIGRLNRWTTSQDCGTCLMVIPPFNHEIGYYKSLNKVYPNTKVLERTRRIRSRLNNNIINMPGDIEPLIEWAYSHDRLPGIESDKDMVELMDQFHKNVNYAKSVAKQRTHSSLCKTDDEEVNGLTRLGALTIKLIACHLVAGQLRTFNGDLIHSKNQRLIADSHAIPSYFCEAFAEAKEVVPEYDGNYKITKVGIYKLMDKDSKFVHYIMVFIEQPGSWRCNGFIYDQKVGLREQK